MQGFARRSKMSEERISNRLEYWPTFGGCKGHRRNPRWQQAWSRARSLFSQVWALRFKRAPNEATWNKHVYLLSGRLNGSRHVPQSLGEDGLIPAGPWRQQAAGASDTAIKSSCLKFTCKSSLSHSDEHIRGLRSINWARCLPNYCELVCDDAAVQTAHRTSGSCQRRKDSGRSTLLQSSRQFFAADYSVPGLLPTKVLSLFDLKENVECIACSWIS